MGKFDEEKGTNRKIKKQEERRRGKGIREE